MNYHQHYHAGHAVDIFKHVVLLGLIEALQKKPTACCYFETHAGLACYDLQAIPSQRSGEYQTGIAKLWAKRKMAMPVLLKNFLRQVRALNPQQQLHYYPGSPWLASQVLRSQDVLILNELHRETYVQLKQQLHYDARAHIHLADGYQQLRALLPPLQKRGLVFIDPSFEQDELFELPQRLQQAYQRWPQGVYALWFPIKERSRIERFYAAIRALTLPKLAIFELCHLADDVPQRLNGSGMIIVNMPWQFEQTMAQNLPVLLELLKVDDRGAIKILV